MNLNTIEILTNDLNATKHFYENVLELPVTMVNDSTMRVKIGASTLRFIECLKNEKPIYHLAFNIPNNKLDEVINWCESKIQLLKKDDGACITNFESWNANAVYFYDNNGNVLEFIARKDLNNSVQEPFSSKQILNISEIGIVAANPLALGKQFIQDYELQFFKKNKNSKVFTVLGDDDGLLIIVIPNRDWYSTQIPAKSNWTKIALTNNDKKSSVIELT